MTWSASATAPAPSTSVPPSTSWPPPLGCATSWWFVVRFHGLRAPGYGLKLVWRAPVGLYRLPRLLIEVVVPAEARPLRAAAVRKEDAAEYLKLRRDHDVRVRVRLVVALVLLAGSPPCSPPAPGRPSGS